MDLIELSSPGNGDESGSSKSPAGGRAQSACEIGLLIKIQLASLIRGTQGFLSVWAR